ncbi:YopX family protein [Staphylococcus saprophyticus]|uniref:YopX family protein n=1 Tax=Staphylococcus saprophyticus TaxID=29385 RepID=UPI0024C3E511|nr:YopX family protein [Staphylococcus saprophyticus]MDK1672835.1 YopX family protein [Staphylococcus saprophyticus]
MIKFRFWDKDEKYFITEATIVLDKDGSVEGIEYYHTKLGHSVYNDISYYELMQSTGHKDKHGVEIFESDVVKHDPVPNPFYTNINFEIVRARTGEWRIDSFRGGSVLAFHNHQIEIIGNIYENSELIEE